MKGMLKMYVEANLELNSGCLKMLISAARLRFMGLSPDDSSFNLGPRCGNPRLLQQKLPKWGE